MIKNTGVDSKIVKLVVKHFMDKAEWLLKPVKKFKKVGLIHKNVGSY